MIRALWTGLVFLTATVALATLAVGGGLLRRGRDLTFRLTRVWGRLILGAAGVRVRFEGTPDATDGQPRIFMSNHQSAVDIWVLPQKLPDSTRFVAKSSLFRIPFLGWAMTVGGFVPIDRQDRDRAIRSLSVAARRLDEGESLIVFPEGTRSRNGRLGPFKKGPFHLALAAGRPVVPVAISGSFGLLPPRSVLVRSGEVLVRFAPEIDPARFAPDDVGGLMSAVRRAIEQRLSTPSGRCEHSG